MIISHETVRGICSIAEELSGTRISFDLSSSEGRTSIKMWFEDLGRPRSPIITMRPSGIKRHLVELGFGTNAKPTLLQMDQNSSEAYDIANSLIESTQKYCEVESSFGLGGKWNVSDAGFQLKMTRKSIPEPLSSDAFYFTCQKVVVPLMAALAELIGYEEDSDAELVLFEGEEEGGILKATVLKRERSRKNRYLCLEHHGEVCKVCGYDPRKHFKDIPSLIEVHHLTPLSNIEKPKIYNPITDLVPLCPTCHRAIHSKKPVPFTVDELKERLITQNPT